MSARPTPRRAALGLAAAALALPLALAPLSAASAEVLPPTDKYLGAVELFPKSGTFSEPRPWTNATTTSGCPAGTTRSHLWYVNLHPNATGATEATVQEVNQTTRTRTSPPQLAGFTGIGPPGEAGGPISHPEAGRSFLDYNYTVPFEVLLPPHTEDSESDVVDYAFVISCLADGYEGLGNPVTEASEPGLLGYFSGVFTVDRLADTFTVKDAPGPIEKVTPDVSITRAVGNADGTVTLTAALTGAGAAITDADGVVTFAADGVTGSAAVTAAGTATWKSAPLAAGRYQFIATYQPNASDAKYTASAPSAAQGVEVVAEPQDPVDRDITVTIPKEITGLKLTVAPGALALGEATLDGQNWVATGELPAVTVNDARSAKTAWSLGARSTPMVHAGDAAKKLSAQYLGWEAPTVTGATGGGAKSDLRNDQTLATGTQQARSTIGAKVTLNVPTSEVSEGAYAGTLTLTLI